MLLSGVNCDPQSSRMADQSSKESDAANSLPQRTIFVRNLPYNTTNKKLEDAFSEFGPIKQAFVVKDQGKLLLSIFCNTGKSKSIV